MPFIKYDVSLAIPCDSNGTLSAANKKITNDFEKAVAKLREKSVKINEGKHNEENTMVTTKHICFHDVPDNKISCSDSMVEIE